MSREDEAGEPGRRAFKLLPWAPGLRDSNIFAHWFPLPVQNNEMKQRRKLQVQDDIPILEFYRVIEKII